MLYISYTKQLDIAIVRIPVKVPMVGKFPLDTSFLYAWGSMVCILIRISIPLTAANIIPKTSPSFSSTFVNLSHSHPINAPKGCDTPLINDAHKKARFRDPSARKRGYTQTNPSARLWKNNDKNTFRPRAGFALVVVNVMNPSGILCNIATLV